VPFDVVFGLYSGARSHVARSWILVRRTSLRHVSLMQ